MDADKVIGATFSAVVVAECDKAANVDKKAALIAAQPVLAVKASSGKTVKTFTTTFASVAGNALVECPVDLQFRDLNNDNALQPYEDWTKAADARAADLVGRMPVDQKMALQLHPSLADTNVLLPATLSLITSGVRYGLSTATSLQPKPRATWANSVQEACEATQPRHPLRHLQPAGPLLGQRAGQGQGLLASGPTSSRSPPATTSR